MGRDIDGRGENRGVALPLPYIGSKWSRTDFDSYFEHKLLCSCQKILFGGKQTLSFFSPQRGSIESFGFRFFFCWGPKIATKSRNAPNSNKETHFFHLFGS